MAAALTSQEVDEVTGSLASVIADGAFDQDGVYAEVAEPHPDAAVIVPPRCTAVLSDRHLQCIDERGRMGWQQASGYNKRARVEAAIERWKQVINGGLGSRMDEGRLTGVKVAVGVLHRMLELGRPSYVRIV